MPKLRGATEFATGVYKKYIEGADDGSNKADWVYPQP